MLPLSSSSPPPHRTPSLPAGVGPNVSVGASRISEDRMRGVADGSGERALEPACLGAGASPRPALTRRRDSVLSLDLLHHPPATRRRAHRRHQSGPPKKKRAMVCSVLMRWCQEVLVEGTNVQVDGLHATVCCLWKGNTMSDTFLSSVGTDTASCRRRETRQAGDACSAEANGEEETRQAREANSKRGRSKEGGRRVKAILSKICKYKKNSYPRSIF